MSEAPQEEVVIVEEIIVVDAPQTIGMAGNYTYQFPIDTVDHEMPPNADPMVVPRHDKYAAENSGAVAERVVPYTATNANPSYAEGEMGIGEADPGPVLDPVEEVPAEPAPDAPPAEPAPGEAVPEPGPADIPAPPEVPAEPVPDAPAGE